MGTEERKAIARMLTDWMFMDETAQWLFAELPKNYERNNKKNKKKNDDEESLNFPLTLSDDYHKSMVTPSIVSRYQQPPINTLFNLLII